MRIKKLYLIKKNTVLIIKTYLIDDKKILLIL